MPMTGAYPFMILSFFSETNSAVRYCTSFYWSIPNRAVWILALQETFVTCLVLTAKHIAVRFHRAYNAFTFHRAFSSWFFFTFGVSSTICTLHCFLSFWLRLDLRHNRRHDLRHNRRHDLRQNSRFDAFTKYFFEQGIVRERVDGLTCQARSLFTNQLIWNVCSIVYVIFPRKKHILVACGLQIHSQQFLSWNIF